MINRKKYTTGAWKLKNPKDIPSNEMEIFLYITQKGKPGVIIFEGNREKPRVWSYFSTEIARKQYVERYIETVRTNLRLKNEKKEYRKNFINPLKPGDILYTNWGYDQTNVEFYQVIKTTGRKVQLRELRQIKTDRGFMSGNTRPAKDSFFSKEILNRMVMPSKGTSGGFYVKINDSVTAWLWDGKTKSYSSYA